MDTRKASRTARPQSQRAFAPLEGWEVDSRASGACYVMKGGADYLLRVLAQSLVDYEAFVRTHRHLIEGIASINTSFAHGAVQRAARFPKD